MAYLPSDLMTLNKFGQQVQGERRLKVDSVISDSGLQKTALRELSVAEPTPIGQIDAIVGFIDKVATFTFDGGTVSDSENLFQSISGTDPNAISSVVTSSQGKVRPGQGLISRTTAIFDTPQLDNIQQTGLVSINNRAVFGYVGTTFGIILVTGGKFEIQELTITTPAGGSEDATVTVNGIAYTVPLTAGSAAHNAFEIAASLSAQDPTYVYSSNADNVVARSGLPFTPVGAFAFTSATAAGTWEQLSAAVDPITDIIPQSSWNLDTMPLLNPAAINYYQVRAGQSSGRIEFAIEDPEGRGLVTVHQQNTNNLFGSLRITNNHFRAGWININKGNTTSVNLKGSEASLFVEGKTVIDEPSRATDNLNPAVPTGSFVNLLTLRNRSVFKDEPNRHAAFGLVLAITSNSSKSTFIRAEVNAEITGDDVIFEYVEKDNSVMELYKGPGVVTPDTGRLTASAVVGPNAQATLGLQLINSLLPPGARVTVSARVSSGNASEVSCSAVWLEDL